MRVRSMVLSSFAFALSVGLWACNDEGPGSGNRPPGVQEQGVSLTSFDTCDNLESYIHQVAIREMELRIDAMEETILAGSLPPMMSEIGGDEGSAMTRTVGPQNSGAPTDFTTTNNQVEGVQEGDIVKNDGSRIFAIAGGKLHLAKSWPPQDLSLTTSVSIEGHPRSLFLQAEKNRVVVISSVSAGNRLHGTDMHDIALSCPANARCDISAFYRAMTKVTVFKLVEQGNTGSPFRVIDERYYAGSFAQGRRIDGSVRLVLRDSVRWPTGVEFYAPSRQGDMFDIVGTTNDIVRETSVEKLKAKNRELIRNTPYRHWFPGGIRWTNGTPVETEYNCSDVYHADVPVHLGLAKVITLNMENLDDGTYKPNQTIVLGEPSEVYASKESLYIASRHWWWWQDIGQSDFTYLHKFNIKNPDRAIPVASGAVPGHIVNQFALDEHNDHLRVATTINTLVPDEEFPWRPLTTNRVTVLAQRGHFLVPTGRTEDLADGERIYSARFVGDKGFLVTFRQVDPLFTLDLSNPRNPKKIGELKVPGFSTYIHPLGENHLLTIGIHVPDQTTRTTREPGGDTSVGVSVSNSERHVKLSLFDVSDFANPKEVFTQAVGTAHGWSEATYDHKAFNYFASQGLLAIPFSDWRTSYRQSSSYWSDFVSGIRLYKVDPVSPTPIAFVGEFSLKDVFMQRGVYDWGWYYSPWVTRSIMATDDTNTYVYAISDVAIGVANVSALDAPLATAILPQWDPYDPMEN